MIENVLTYPAPADSRFSRKSFHRGFFSLLLTALLLLGALAPGAAISARADEVTSMKIYRGRYYDATPFQVSNMFPGDREENRYTIRISYKGDLTLHFQPEIRPGSEKLAEVLRCRIRIEDETVYEGLLRDAPPRMRYELSSQQKTVQTVAYDITVWMDTSAGNEYKNQKLLCDFYWWVDVEDADKLEPPAQTGDQILSWVLIAGVSGVVLAVILWRKGKEESHNV